MERIFHKEIWEANFRDRKNNSDMRSSGCKLIINTFRLEF